jgi:two-component system, LytTR family, response regulator
MAKIRTLIVDDERLARERLRQLLAQEPDIEVTGECATGNEALRWFRESPPDVAFLDVQMPELDGFGLIEAAPPESLPLFVFVTAYDEYALRAFEVDAVDYLLKPFDQERLRKTLDRVRARLQNGTTRMDERALAATLNRLRAPRVDRLVIRDGAHLAVVRTDSIDWVEAADNYVVVHCGPVTHILRETLNSLESSLDDSVFVRIHRSTIVNLDRVKELQPWFRGDYRVILQDGTVLTLSRTFKDRVQSRLLRWA